jgi:polar amino acid transport system substrate-binding protein
MKLKFLVTVMMLMAILLVACQTTQQTDSVTAVANQSHIDRILAAGELRVGTSASQPPLNMKDRDGHVFGLEVDLARILAESMGVELRLVEKPFKQLLDTLDAGEVDLVISGLTITPKRNLRVAFVGPYFLSGKSFLTKYKTLAEAQSLDAIEEKNVTLTALEGSTSQDLVAQVLPEVKLTPAASYEAALRLLDESQVDALVADYPFCFYAVLRHPEKAYVASITPITYEPLGIAMPGDDPQFINLVTNLVNTLRDSGKLDVMKKRWFVDRAWMERMAY